MVIATPADIEKVFSRRVADIKNALPKAITLERMQRLCTTEFSMNPSLRGCSAISFLSAAVRSAQLGLEPGNGLGHCFFVPFQNRKAGTNDVQLIIGYRGMIDLAYRSGKVISVMPRVVYNDNEFRYQYGTNAHIFHVPADVDEDDKNITHAYVVVEFANGSKQFEVMTRAAIDKTMKESKSSSFQNSPWKKHFDQMAMKSVVRKVFKYLPVSIEVQRAAIFDEYTEAGIDQGRVFENDLEVDVPQKEEKKDPVLEVLDTGNDNE